MTSSRFCVISQSVLICLIAVVILGAGREQRPFWTEKSAFVEGDHLYVVGVATKVQTSEAGRLQAFEHGRRELMNYAQVTNLETHGLVIETQMTYEEPNPDGTITVFRLLRVPATKLTAIQDRVRTQTRTQEQALEKARVELAQAQHSLALRQQELETRSRTLKETYDAVARLQSALTEKATKIEQQQRYVEGLLSELVARIGVQKAQAATTTAQFPLVERLKEAEAQLEVQEQELVNIALRIQKRIDQETENVQKRCKHLSRGMTREDVKAIMGRHPDSDPSGGLNPWQYRARDPVELSFSGSGGLSSIHGCLSYERPSRR